MISHRSLTDDELVEALDDALESLRSGSKFDSTTWLESHPQLNREGTELLRTLVELNDAARTWTGDEAKPEQAPRSGNARGVPPDVPESIGRYRIRRHVGSGAMGDVFEAYDPQLDRQVAVKRPRCERLAKDRARFTERFLREARAAACVRHAHICPIYDAGEHDGKPYVVMAFVEGQTLEQLLKRGRIENLTQAAELAAQVAEALQAIHEHGIIHRDLKPGNILIDESGQALLTDFGLAVSSLADERLTSDGVIVGTPVYLSPEQAAGDNRSLTPAADIYSLGAVFYEMLTGRVPFRAPLLELLRQIKSDQPAPPESLRPELPETLRQAAMRAMAKQPKDRFPSAAAFAATLRDWIAASSDDPTNTVIEPQPAPTAKPAMVSRRIVAAVLVGALITAALLPFVIGRSPQRSAKVEANPADTSASAVATPAPLPPAHPAELTGDFSILISSDPQKGEVTKNRIRVEERRAYPLRTGELVQFEVQMNQPAYVYLLWVSSDGSVTPLYPWDAERFEGFQAPLLAGGDRPQDRVICPSSRREGFEAADPAGLQTFVLLARKTPLPEGVDLQQLLVNLPSAPELDTRLAMMEPRLRGIKTGQTKSLESALFSQLETRLSPHFELVRMMTFPQVSE